MRGGPGKVLGQRGVPFRATEAIAREIRRQEPGLLLQGIPVGDTEPTEGDVLTYSAALGAWIPFQGGAVTVCKNPLLSYNSASVINIGAPPGFSYPLKIPFPDGKVRSISGQITWDIATMRDSTVAEAASVWYYLYAYPDPTNDNAWKVTGSRSSTAPVGYPNYYYLGPAYNDASSNLWRFHHIQKSVFVWEDTSTEPTNFASTFADNTRYASYTNFNLDDKLPLTAYWGLIGCEIKRTTVTGFTLESRFRIEGQSTGSYWAIFSSEGSGVNQMYSTWMPFPGATSKVAQYQSTRSGGLVEPNYHRLAVFGFVDAALEWRA
ncbi:MAG: hypothetical protein E6R03_17605 [Hyphomicrobiaceae bacterium]|nr:MAG: hypothetical protein E6R03_17605 [Hyphomicrobiaceae bacterium]